jgi:nascent polypeptide-associated complex subunit alpha
MIPGIDPKKMQAMMKQMGMSQEEIHAKRVIIECEDKNIIIEDPSVMKVKMQGQTNFQISGDIREEASSSPEDDEDSRFAEDIKTIIEKTGCSEENAKQALEDSNGDLAEAILSLS